MTSASAAHAFDVGVAGEQLARQRRMILARVAFADAVLHQPRQARQPGDRRINAALEQIAVQHDLAFGDVAGQVGHRMADVVGGHRQNRNLRDRAGRAFDAAGAFVKAREVGIEIAGITFAAGDFAARRADFAQALAVVRHVRQQHEHVLAAVERQMLGQRQRHARRQQPLDARRIGQREEHHRAGQRAGVLENCG